MAEISAEETIFIAYREDIKTLHDKWHKIFDAIGYDNVPIAVCNASISVKDALESVNYKIEWERNGNGQE